MMKKHTPLLRPRKRENKTSVLGMKGDITIDCTNAKADNVDETD